MIADFDAHFQPVKNVIYERMRFNQIVQKPGQLIHQFITEVQTQADNCEFDKMNAELVRDRIVVGAGDQKLREYLVDIDDLDLPKCISKAKQFTANRAQMSSMAGHEGNLDAVSTERFNKNSGGDPTRKDLCYCCVKRSHPREKCPARNTKGTECGDISHWFRSKACKGKRKGTGKVQSFVLSL